ncbi:uncharacterized protein PgNI_00129 [Pyricularia grisea]|uniref:Uncharacterized protein n=1 Tax=Pyricularia grisea TaxID=148305 RepID=A0A6P8BJZ5_PYRGI|nr:uncharacterized protein PgNI_00129 [Pyricularia grisea]TLD16995.1 hypothetical protein PgNI_00129 [Pyricularia grisea]
MDETGIMEGPILVSSVCPRAPSKQPGGQAETRGHFQAAQARRQSPPVSIPEVASPAPLPVCTTAPTQGSAASYNLPTYSTSLPSDPQIQPAFSNPYKQQPYLQKYQPAYPTTMVPGLPSHYGLAVLGDEAVTALTLPHSRVNLASHAQQHRQQAPGLMYANAMSIMGSGAGFSPPHHPWVPH